MGDPGTTAVRSLASRDPGIIPVWEIFPHGRQAWSISKAQRGTHGTSGGLGSPETKEGAGYTGPEDKLTGLWNTSKPRLLLCHSTHALEKPCLDTGTSILSFTPAPKRQRQPHFCVQGQLELYGETIFQNETYKNETKHFCKWGQMMKLRKYTSYSKFAAKDQEERKNI